LDASGSKPNDEVQLLRVSPTTGEQFWAYGCVRNSDHLGDVELKRLLEKGLVKVKVPALGDAARLKAAENIDVPVDPDRIKFVEPVPEPLIKVEEDDFDVAGPALGTLVDDSQNQPDPVDTPATHDGISTSLSPDLSVTVSGSEQEGRGRPLSTVALPLPYPEEFRALRDLAATIRANREKEEAPGLMLRPFVKRTPARASRGRRGKDAQMLVRRLVRMF
jgi:hypothetical protein